MRAAVVLAAVAVMAGCTPLYAPPIPNDPVVGSAAYRVAGASQLLHQPDASDAGRLRLQISFVEFPEDAWLALQWFGPLGGERASDSRYITRAEALAGLVWDSPDDMALEPGRWRAVLSLGSVWLRQFDVTIESRP